MPSSALVNCFVTVEPLGILKLTVTEFILWIAAKSQLTFSSCMRATVKSTPVYCINWNTLLSCSCCFYYYWYLSVSIPTLAALTSQLLVTRADLAFTHSRPGHCETRANTVSFSFCNLCFSLIAASSLSCSSFWSLATYSCSAFSAASLRAFSASSLIYS